MDRNAAFRQRGFSLLEVMVALALLGVGTYFLVSMLKNGSMGQKTLQAQDDARVLIDDMAGLLSNPAACKNTFGGANPVTGAPVSTIMDTNGKPQFTLGNVYGNRGLKLLSITIGGYGTDAKTKIQQWVPGTAPNTGTAFVQVVWLQTGNTGNQGTGPASLYRYFLVFVNQLSGNSIVSCTAQAGGASGYWTLNSANNIYNNNGGGTGYVGIGTTDPGATFDVEGTNGIVLNAGNVGIGTTKPATALDVPNGGIRPMAASPNTACSPAYPLGATAYNSSTGAPLYCNSAGMWVQSGFTSCTVVPGGGSATCTTGTLTGGGCQVSAGGMTFPVLNGSTPSGNTWTCSGPAQCNDYGCVGSSAMAYAICCQ